MAASNLTEMTVTSRSDAASDQNQVAFNEPFSSLGTASETVWLHQEDVSFAAVRAQEKEIKEHRIERTVDPSNLYCEGNLYPIEVSGGMEKFVILVRRTC